MAIIWSTVLFFDSFIFTVTLYKALCIWKMGIGKLSVLLLRDGMCQRTLNFSQDFYSDIGTVYYL